MRLRTFGRALAAGLSTVTVASVMLLITGGPAMARAAATSAAISRCTVSVNGPAVTMKVTAPGRSAKCTFHGSVGQRIAVVITNPVSSDSGCQTLTLTGPNGPVGNSPQTQCGNGTPVAIGPVDLTAPGTYTVRLEFDPTATGHGTLWVSAPVSVGTAGVNGPSTPMKVTRVGQGVHRTFTGKVGQRIAVVITNPVSSNSGCQTLTLTGPNGPAGNSPQTQCGNGTPVAIGPFDLTAPGTYTARLEFDPTATGHGTLWVSAPVNVGTVSVNGSAKPMTVTRVGQGVERTFHGTHGEHVNVVISNPVTSNSGCQTVWVFGPGPRGGQVGNSPQTQCGNGTPVAVSGRLSGTGTYTVLFEVDPVATGHGSLRVST